MSNTTLTNNFEGVSNGTAFTTSNSASGGNAFTAMDAGVLVSTTSAKAHGSAGCSVTNTGATGTGVARWAMSSESIGKQVLYVNMSAYPTTGAQFLSMRVTGDTVTAVQALVSTTGKLTLTANGGVQWTDTLNFPLNQWVRVELYTNVGTSNVTGVARLAYFLADSTTATADSGTITGIDCGGATGTLINARYAKAVSSNWGSFTYTIDDAALYTGTNALLGTAQPASIPAAPTIVGGSKQVLSAGGSTVNITATATPGSGATISNYTWSAASWPAGQSAPTITNPTAQTASFTPVNAQGRYTFNVTATDNFSQTSPTTVVEVDITGTGIYPIAVTANSGWTVGAVTDGTDASDATYYESGAPGSNGILVLRLAPMVSNGTSFPLDVRDLVQSAGGTQRVELVEGATTTSDGTVRKNWGAIAPGTSFADQILTLTTGEMATIVDWTALHLRLTQV